MLTTSTEFHRYVQRARRDFVAAGEAGHFDCPITDSTGRDGTRHCVMSRLYSTTGCSGLAATLLEREWGEIVGEQPIETNARSFAACVAAYDKILLHLTAGRVERRDRVPA